MSPFEVNSWFRLILFPRSLSLSLSVCLYLNLFLISFLLVGQQICNLRDPEFIKYFESLSQSHKLIEQSIPPSRGDATTSSTSTGNVSTAQIQAVGWFYETEYESMRKLVKQILYRRMDEFISRQQQILYLSSQQGETIRIVKPKHLAYEGQCQQQLL
jgi:hypothetical protein